MPLTPVLTPAPPAYFRIQVATPTSRDREFDVWIFRIHTSPRDLHHYIFLLERHPYLGLAISEAFGIQCSTFHTHILLGHPLLRHQLPVPVLALCSLLLIDHATPGGLFLLLH